MLRKKTTLVLSACFAPLAIGVGYTFACGGPFETGKFANRTFESPSTMPSNYCGVLFRLDHIAAATLPPNQHYLYTLDTNKKVQMWRLSDGAELETFQEPATLLENFFKNPEALPQNAITRNGQFAFTRTQAGVLTVHALAR